MNIVTGCLILLSLVPIIRSGNRPGLPGVVRCEHSDWLSEAVPEGAA